MESKIGILGGGSWGTALGITLANKGNDVNIWIRDEKQYRDIKKNRINKKYLPNIILPEKLKPTNDIKEAIVGNEVIVLAVPTHGIRENLLSIKDIVKPEQIIVNVAKGIENDTLKRISEIVKEILPDNKYVVLSGPSHAEEVGLEKPTTVIAASEHKDAAKFIQDIFMTINFRVYTHSDVIGVELGGALKNVIALGAGISDGLEYGDNAKAAIMNRGIFEISRLGQAMGGKLSTFSGLSGIGDLIVTCTSLHSRNRKAGLLIGQGMSVEEAIEKTGMVVEGIKTTKSVYDLSQKYNVEMPISEEIYKIIYENKDVKEATESLMGRDKKFEMEDLI